MKRLVFSTEVCVQCQDCEICCSMRHTGVFNPSLARIRCTGFEGKFPFSVQVCFQCDRPACVTHCREGAIQKEPETGVVKIDRSRCNNCLDCVDACPYGAIFWTEGLDHPVKCELCEGEPECVMSCPTGALAFQEAEMKDLKAQQKAARIIKKRS